MLKLGLKLVGNFVFQQVQGLRFSKDNLRLAVLDSLQCLVDWKSAGARRRGTDDKDKEHRGKSFSWFYI